MKPAAQFIEQRCHTDDGEVVTININVIAQKCCKWNVKRHIFLSDDRTVVDTEWRVIDWR